MQNGERKQDRGFIVHAFTRLHRRETQLCLAGRLENGETFGAVLSGERPRFYLRAGDGDRARRLASASPAIPVALEPTAFATMDGEPCLRAEARSESQLAELAARLAAGSIRTYESDIRLPDAYLMDHAVHGSVALRGDWQGGRRVDRVYLDPGVEPSDWAPSLALASIDIETNPFGEEIYAISIHFRSWGGELEELVLLHPPAGDEEKVSAQREALLEAANSGGWHILLSGSEEELLRRFSAEIVRLDPDLITGWNVTGFDFERITSRLHFYTIPFRIGRSGEDGVFFPATTGKPATVVVPGRQVIDALRIARAGPRRFADHSLETVAQEVLGRGKKIEARGTRERLERIRSMYQEDPVSLCSYCLEDARLVTEILDKTGLLDLTLKRSLLIGVPLSRAWTSIAAFDFVYIEAMHARDIVAPAVGVDSLPMDSAPGGAIISPTSGLFDNVLVFDFKSLYPSIMRTFNVDPLSFAGRAEELRLRAEPELELIRAPNGACFRRGAAILPSLLEHFFADREEARRRGDKTAVHVYKILMNSFYGVLGANGCRFAGSDLAGAITAFGHEILYWCRDLLEERGHHVLYGDTDSLFVESNLSRGAPDEALFARGEELRDLVNGRLAGYLETTYGVRSRLELEFEKIYLRFFIPPLRSQAPGSAAIPRGRAKGYAGYLRGAGMSVQEGDRQARAPGIIEARGIEAVRRDWTQAAKDFQLALLRMLFEDAAREDIAAYVRDYLGKLRSGELDEKLVYEKALRKPVASYASTAPPHVQAARHLDRMDQSGLVSYVWTVAGPQPLLALTDPIDYDHYVEKQLEPIARTFSEVLHADLEELFDADGQLRLF